MNRPTMLITVVVEEILLQHSLDASKDVQTIERRVKSEGDSFLTITLPTLGTALEGALERGFLLRSDCPSFGHDPRSMLPKFLKGLWKKIFTDDGTILSDPDCDAIYGIRQIAYFLKKPKSLCSEKRNRKAIRNYHQIEKDLDAVTDICVREDSYLRSISDILWGDIFSDISPDNIICYHGPGATAEKKSANSKFQITHWNERSMDCFPVDIHALANFGFNSCLEDLQVLHEDEEVPVRVIQVPKTMKTPRTIAIEPSHMMFMQKGLEAYTVERLESNRLTAGSIRFKDQSVNKLCAKRASVNRQRATIDMSDASDRVHIELVKNIFRTSRLLPYLLSSRSTHALLPDSKQPLLLRKFASMGSAMCFPVEAMVFYTLILVALHYYHNEVPSERSIECFSRDIDVYGDDLIVPTYSRRIVTACLEAFGLKVNQNKSFSEGFFRESCGGDYFRGYEVTPIYLRNLPPNKLDRSNPEILVSLVSTSNQLYKKGLWTTCQRLRDLIREISPRKWKIPLSPYVTAGVTFFSVIRTTIDGYSDTFNAFMQKRISLEPISQPDLVPGLNAFLLKALTPSSKRDRDLLISSELMDREDLPLLLTATPTAHLSVGTLLDISSIPMNFPSLETTPASNSRSVKRGVFKVKHRWYNAQMGVLET